jgi:purine-binding chemotaxis protein CheW
MTALCTFTVDGRLAALPTASVREILRAPVVTPVPLAPEGVAGVINVRGTIVTTVDLRHRLGLPAGPARDCLLLRNGDEIVGALVDAVGDVVDAPDAEHHEVPATLPAGLRRFARAAVDVEGQLVLLLDVDVLAAAGSTLSKERP